MLSYNGRPVIGFADPPQPSECACRKIGFGDEVSSPSAGSSPSPWAMAIGTSFIGAATGWMIEELFKRGKKR